MDGRLRMAHTSMPEREFLRDGEIQRPTIGRASRCVAAPKGFERIGQRIEYRALIVGPEIAGPEGAMQTKALDEFSLRDCVKCRPFLMQSRPKQAPIVDFL